MATPWPVKTVDERILLKRLDEIDLSSINQYERYLEDVFFIAEKIMNNNSYSMMQIIQMPFPLQGELGRMLFKQSYDMLAIGQAHAAVLINDLHQKFRRQLKLASPVIVIDPEKFWLEPLAAIEALEARENMLANDIEGQLWADVKKIMLEHLQGIPRKETIAALSALGQVNLRRAELVITTEGTYCYNRGRLKGYREAEVDYVRFSAVMDMRTSSQCRSRHGKVMAMNSPELADNIPPLHGWCRSVLSPIYSAYTPEYLTEDTLNWSKAVPLPKGWRAG